MVHYLPTLDSTCVQESRRYSRVNSIDLVSCASKSVGWVADQPGHADAALTLRLYARAMREEKHDLSFADFGDRDGSERLNPAPAEEPTTEDKDARDATSGERYGNLERETGFEPATLSLRRRTENRAST